MAMAVGLLYAIYGPIILFWHINGESVWLWLCTVSLCINGEEWLVDIGNVLLRQSHHQSNEPSFCRGARHTFFKRKVYYYDDFDPWVTFL